MLPKVSLVTVDFGCDEPCLSLWVRYNMDEPGYWSDHGNFIGTALQLASGVYAGNTPIGILLDRLEEYPEECQMMENPSLLPYAVQWLRSEYPTGVQQAPCMKNYVTVRLNAKTLVEFNWDGPQDEGTLFGRFLRSLQYQRSGRGGSYVARTDRPEVVYTILDEMECRLSLQGGGEGISGAGTAAAAAAVRRDYRRLVAAAKDAGLDVSKYEE